MNTITIEGQLRTEFGKKATRAVRSQDQVPAVIYGGAKEVSFSVPAKALKPLVYTDKFQLVEITIDGQKYTAIMKDLQFDRVSDKLIHIDFLELNDDKKVIANLPLKFVGSAVGVKAGGKFVPKLNTLKVKTLPKHLKEAITVDITNLELNGNLRVEDVKEPDFEIMNSPRIPIASIVLTRQLKQAASAEAASATKK
ncbi:MAG: 50S ribosomal protein L25 [Chitinophagaceae bacterium]